MSEAVSYVIVQGVLKSSRCRIYGLDEAEQEEIIKRFKYTDRRIIFIDLEVEPLAVLMTLLQMGYRLTSRGYHNPNGEVVWPFVLDEVRDES